MCYKPVNKPELANQNTRISISILEYRSNKQTVRFLLADINQCGMGKTKMRSSEVFNHPRRVYIR